VNKQTKKHNQQKTTGSGWGGGGGGGWHQIIQPRQLVTGSAINQFARVEQRKRMVLA